MILKILFFTVLANFVLALDSFALTPPPEGGWPLCKITGIVNAITREEASDETMMNHFEVDVATIEIISSTPADNKNSSQNCSIPPADNTTGKHLAYYRICDDVKLSLGVRIEAIAGASRGGGRFCIEHIKPLT